MGIPSCLNMIRLARSSNNLTGASKASVGSLREVWLRGFAQTEEDEAGEVVRYAHAEDFAALGGGVLGVDLVAENGFEGVVSRSDFSWTGPARRLSQISGATEFPESTGCRQAIRGIVRPGNWERLFPVGGPATNQRFRMGLPDPVPPTPFLHPTSSRPDMAHLRMDNILIVVDDLERMKAFFAALGLELEGQADVEGPVVDRLIGLQGVRATIATMRTPDGHGRIELDKYHSPAAVRVGPEKVPVNAFGIRRIMFAVDDIDGVVARLRRHGAELMGEVVQYGESYRLCYLRGPEGIMVALAQALH